MKKVYLFSVATSIFLLGACGNESNQEEAMEQVELVLNWLPNSQHGGHFAADSEGFFEEQGLDVNIEVGGANVSAIQQVAAGSADFGLAPADRLLMARNEGMELVAIAAHLQSSPQGLMTHEGEHFDDFDDIDGRTVYVEAGIPYWDYLQARYDLDEVNQLSYTGQFVEFIDDPESVTQGFQTQDPYRLGKEGVDVEFTLLRESGYDPYYIVFTSRDFLDENEDTVSRFTDAMSAGYNHLKDFPEEVAELVQNENNEVEIEELIVEAEAQEELVFGGDAEEYGFGYMDEERWETLIDQLRELELLEEDVDAEEVFTNEYLAGD